MGNWYNSFGPLSSTVAGRAAVDRYGLPPFVDGSCRREPDFESAYPSISSLCRFRQFAPRLREGDLVVYVTNKKSFGPRAPAERRLVAVLRVAHRFKSHKLAAQWYRGHGLPLPGNCLVRGNPPLSLDRTHQSTPPDCDAQDTGDAIIRVWDEAYQYRSRACGAFLVCEPLFRELHHPPVLTDGVLLQIRDPVPRPQSAIKLGDEQLRRLLGLALRGDPRRGAVLAFVEAAIASRAAGRVEDPEQSQRRRGPIANEQRVNRRPRKCGPPPPTGCPPPLQRR